MALIADSCKLDIKRVLVNVFMELKDQVKSKSFQAIKNIYILYKTGTGNEFDWEVMGTLQ